MIPDFVRDLARHGERTALIVPGEGTVSYADLARRTAAFAARLPGPRRLVAVEAAASAHAITAYLGTLAAGHAVALLPSGDSDAMRGFADRFHPESQFRRLDGRWRLLAGGRAQSGEIHPDLALILMTSGSTGHGKGVRLSGTALESNAGSIAEYLKLGPEDRAGLVLPLHYSYGLSVLNSHLAAGACLWLHQGSVLAPGFLDGLASAGCTNLSGVPHTFELLERIGLKDAALPRLRMLTVAGGAMAADRVQRWHDHMATRDGRFFAMYGQTEATARIAYLPPELAGQAPDRIGIAIPGGSLSLRAADGRTIGEPGVEGELIYRGANVMMGYAETRADLARGTEIDALATGDLAVRDEAGLYRIVGRLRRMSKIAGVRVGHDAVEAALAAQGIRAAVVGDDCGLTASYVSAQDPEEVADLIVRATGLTNRHVRVVRVPDLPRLASGKVDYESLRKNTPAQRASSDLAGVFRHCFDPRPVRPSDSFASLGGDSLRHVELSMEVERLLGHLPRGWERMSLSELGSIRHTPGPSNAAGAGIGADLLIRALAILAVLVQHQTLWPTYGGAAAMVVLIGYGLGRFQRGFLATGDVPGLLRPLWKVLVPYYLILIAYALVWGQVPWVSVFLAGNFGFGDPVRQDMLPYLYWFVEAYTQLLLVLALLALIPTVRRLIGAEPFRFGLLLLAGASVARLVGPELWPLGGRQIFTLPWIFYLCAFGWCAATADSRGRRLAVLAAAALLMPAAAFLGGNWFGAWIKYSAQFAVIAALLYLPHIRMPRAVARIVLEIARASFLIYLLHRFAPEVLMLPLAGILPGPVFDLLAIFGGVALGVAASVPLRHLPEPKTLLTLRSRMRRTMPA
ncbi:MAG TPA: AMP-binding protein [Albidovulum sp.]|uniref:AMP-binding protein n=1 Tax=Albidovulum sp. TaxID=1872424 RepID=UPI002C38C267|nr:AMP-binding protein [Albidovulum sp.]